MSAIKSVPSENLVSDEEFVAALNRAARAELRRLQLDVEQVAERLMNRGLEVLIRGQRFRVGFLDYDEIVSTLGLLAKEIRARGVTP
jgi:hypothetical protein